MFSYFGSKSKMVKFYSKPKHNIIIEPFAGSAKYAFHYWDRQVILIEKNKITYDIWDWLINEATEEDIISIPEYQHGQRIIHDNPVIRNFIALENCPGTSRPRNYPNYRSMRKNRKIKLAGDLHKIKHWKIINGDYSLAPDIKATWFIDPPYTCKQSKTSDGYGNDRLDHAILADWCRNRQGQTIVCEELLADWLPFEFLGAMMSTRAKLSGCIEAFWENENL